MKETERVGGVGGLRGVGWDGVIEVTTRKVWDSWGRWGGGLLWVVVAGDL